MPGGEWVADLDNRAVDPLVVVDGLIEHLVERSITSEWLVDELEKVLATTGGQPMVLRMDNRPELGPHALQRFCENRTGVRDSVAISVKTIKSLGESNRIKSRLLLCSWMFQLGAIAMPSWAIGLEL